MGLNEGAMQHFSYKLLEPPQTYRICFLLTRKHQDYFHALRTIRRLPACIRKWKDRYLSEKPYIFHFHLEKKVENVIFRRDEYIKAFGNITNCVFCSSISQYWAVCSMCRNTLQQFFLYSCLLCIVALKVKKNFEFENNR